MALRNEYPKRVGPAAMPTGVSSVVYTAPERVVVHRWTFSNTTGITLAVTLNVVPSPGTANAGNQIIPALSVPANDTIIVEAPIILEQGERVFALSSGAVNLTFNVNDREAEVI